MRFRYLLPLFAFAALAANAQSLTISGTVSDRTGVVPGVAVKLRNPAGKVEQSQTDGAGQYRFTGLSRGEYEISFGRSGYADAVRGLNLTTESRTVDVTVEVSSVSMSIDVIDAGGKTTGSRMDVPDREIPSQISVITQQTLREQGINDLATALENASGVSVQVQYGAYEWYTMGGFTQQSGNDFLFVDGMTQTGNRSRTQLTSVEEIQVLKGPNAVLYGGAGAGQGGMVNLIRKKPQAQRSQEIYYRAGRFGLQEAGAGTAGQVFGVNRLIYRADSSFSNQDGWRGNAAKRFTMAPVLTWLINDRMQISFNQTFVRDRYLLDAGVPTALLGLSGIPLDRKLNPAGDFQATRSWENTITFNSSITNRLRLRNTFYKRRNRDQYLDAETMSYNAALNQVDRTYLYFQHNRRPTQNTTDILGDYDWLGRRHRFVLPYDYQDQYNYTNRTGNAAGASNSLGIPLPAVKIADFLKPGYVDPAPLYTNFPVTRRDFSTNSVNAFAWQDQINITRKLSINVAGRYDDYKRRAHNDSYNDGVFVSRGAETARHQTSYTYRAGAVYALTRNDSIYFSSATGFAPVTTIPADGREFVPQRSRSLEIGNKWTGMGGRLLMTAAMRRILEFNKLISLGNQLFDQAGRTSSNVVEFDLQGDLRYGMRATANYGFADAKFDDFRTATVVLSGLRQPNAPKHTGKVFLTKGWRLGEFSKITGSLGGRYSARYYANQTNTNLVPSRLTFSAAAGLVQPRYDVTVNVENFTNRQRYFVSQINGGGQLYPGAPFAATLTFRYRFN